MRVLVKLFNCDQTATDGSRIPRSVVEAYLNSSKFRDLLDKGMINGGITHENRVLPEDSGLKGVVGRDDNMLRCDNITHVVENVYLDGNDVMAVARILDESNMDEGSAQKIRKLKGLISNGVLLPISAVLSAYWDSSEIAEELVAIKGFDVTMNPSFSGAGVLKVVED